VVVVVLLHAPDDDGVLCLRTTYGLQAINGCKLSIMCPDVATFRTENTCRPGSS